MTHTSQPPFRADQVGSLLRPPLLQQARDRYAQGEITRAALAQVEDDAIRDVVAMQASVGLRGVTDGEFRRAIWHVDFLTGFEGIDATQSNYAVLFKGDQGETGGTSSMMELLPGLLRNFMGAAFHGST